MSRWLPSLTLSLLLLVALAILAVGWKLSRSQRIDVHLRDRTQLQSFAARARAELRNLENVFEEKLSGTIRELNVGDASSVRESLDAIVGIAVCEWSHAAEEPQTIEVDYREYLPIDSERRTHPSAMTQVRGWSLHDPVLPRYSLTREDGWRVSLVLFAPAVERTLTAALAPLKIDFRRLQSGAEDLEEWVDPTGRTMVAANRTADTFEVLPDVIVPLHSRFGTWELRSWDRRNFVIVEDQGLQLGASLASGILMLTGVGLFVHQRRTARMAARRVSFVNRVSHELRTPLTNMLLNLDLASEEVAAPGKAAARLGLVREESDRLARLIDNVLTFSRVEQGRLETDVRDVDIAALIANTVASFSPLLERRGIHLELSMKSPLAWRTDPDAVNQILANLLSNLEKYAPKSTANLTVTASADSLCLRLSDDGPGIDESDAQRIFRPFERVHGTVTEGVSGTGLGLNIARDLAEKLGGSLALIPSATGASFELRLPRMEVGAS